MARRLSELSDQEAGVAALLAGSFVFLAFVAGLACCAVAGFALTYEVNFWLAYSHKASHFPLLAGILIAIIPGRIMGVCRWLFCISAVITFVASYFV